MQEFSVTLDLTDKSGRQVSMASNMQCYSQKIQRANISLLLTIWSTTV